MKRYSLLLISPRARYHHEWDLKGVAATMRKKAFLFPLALPTVASLTPDHYQVRIIDEEMEDIPKGITPDLVGITAMLSMSGRAFEIADGFRAKGIPVVFGGSFATCCPDEALKHADSVVKGEAEGVWPQCLADFEQGRLKKTYQAGAFADFKRHVPPRWDLVDTSNVMVLGVQASRGCPYGCEFCLVPSILGTAMRYRDIDDVVAELESLPSKIVLFVDDNLTANKEYSRRLMARIRPLGISWTCQSSIDVTFDAGLLAAMADAGCNSILVGFESVNPESLEEAGKRHNKIGDYEEAVRRIHAAGIHVIGSFMVGFDSDSPKVFDSIFEFTQRNNIAQVILSVMSPCPGTALYDRMKREGRLIDAEPELYVGMFPTMRYKNISASDMVLRYLDLLKRTFDYANIRGKAKAVLGNGAFNKKSRVKISFRDKIATFLSLACSFVFSADRSRRGMFFDLVKLAGSGAVTMDKAVEYMMFVDAFARFGPSIEHELPSILQKVRINEMKTAAPARRP